MPKKKGTGSDYPVGYKKPPEHSRWRPGQSGNPSGRRKKPKLRNANDLIEQAMAALAKQVVTTTATGKSVRKAKLEFAIDNLATLVAKGDLKAWNTMLKVFQMAERLQLDSQLPQAGGVLVVPAEMSIEEWVEKCGKPALGALPPSPPDRGKKD